MDVWSDPQLGNRLRDVMTAQAEQASGSGAGTGTGTGTKCSRLSPALAFGRHRGPARDRSRVAAVTIALFWQADQWMVPLTMRPTTLQHHGGQICLPGGQIEAGETPRQAALREYEEELGLRPDVIADCGELPMKYVFGSDNLVHTVVLTTKTPSEVWRPDPIEVAEVIVLPLRTWLNTAPILVPKSKMVRQNGRLVDEMRFTTPAIQHEEHLIWGATALILDDLAQLLHSLGP